MPEPLRVTVARRVLLGLCLLTALLGTGCETVRSLVESAPRPSAEVTAARLGDIRLDSATLEFDVDIENPYEVALPVGDLSYAIASGGTSFLEGSAASPGAIPAGATTSTTVTADVQYAALLKVLRDVRPGTLVPYEAAIDLTVDAPGLGAVPLPLKKTGELPIPAVPVVTLDRVAWEQLSLDRASATLHLRIRNVNEFAMKLADLDYGLNLAGRNVASASARKGASMAAGAETQLEIPISLAPKDLGLAAFNMLRGNGSSYELGGTMRVETPYGPMSLPFEKQGQTVFTR